MARKHDRISQIIKVGAFVLPPSKPSAPIEEVVPEPIPMDSIPPTEPVLLAVEESPGIEALVEELEAHWRPTAQPEPEPYHAVDSQVVEVGDVVNAVVVFWSQERKFGFGRKLGDRGGKGRRDGLYFNVVDVITTGEETLCVGSRIMGTVAEPRPGHTDLRLTSVEIYQTEEK
jgi:hypothetical protein